MLPSILTESVFLHEMRGKKVAFRLHPETGKMQSKDTQNCLSKTEQNDIEKYRVGLTEILRREGGICIECGEEKSEKPDNGKLWCEDCFLAGAWKKGLPQKEEKTSADNKTQTKPKTKMDTGEDALF